MFSANAAESDSLYVTTEDTTASQYSKGLAAGGTGLCAADQGSGTYASVLGRDQLRWHDDGPSRLGSAPRCAFFDLDTEVERFFQRPIAQIQAECVTMDM
jgi:hypothetical protein